MGLVSLAFALSANAGGAAKYECGQLQYRGESEKGVGGARYDVLIGMSPDVYLVKRALNPSFKPEQTRLELKKQGYQAAVYTNGELDVIIQRNPRIRDLLVRIEMVSNPDWQATCVRK